MRREVSSNLPLGEIVDGFVIPPHPRGIELERKLVMIQPLSAEKFAAELYEAYQLDPQGNNWTYLPYGPFSTQSEFLNWLRFGGRWDGSCFLCNNQQDHGKSCRCR